MAKLIAFFCLRLLPLRQRPVLPVANAILACGRYSVQDLIVKSLFPHHLIQRPAGAPLEHAAIDIGDSVTVQPVDGPAITSIVIFNTPFLGTTTYTADAEIPVAGGSALERVRLRFRPQDIHHVEHVRRRAA